MSFITLEKMQTGGGRAVGDGRAAVVFTKSATTGGKLYITGKLATQMGWNAKDKVSLAIGTGNDHGTLRISLSATGYTLSNSGGKGSRALSICFNHYNDTVKAFATTEMQHSIIGGAIYVRLPALLVNAKGDAAQTDAGTVYRNGLNEQRVSALRAHYPPFGTWSCRNVQLPR